MTGSWAAQGWIMALHKVILIIMFEVGFGISLSFGS